MFVFVQFFFLQISSAQFKCWVKTDELWLENWEGGPNANQNYDRYNNRLTKVNPVVEIWVSVFFVYHIHILLLFLSC